MERDRPSRTAGWVAFMRALATLEMTGVRGFQDPTAAPLLPAPFAEAYRAATWLEAHGQRDRVKRLLRGVFDALPLRTLAIDAELRAAIGRGAAQVVILGAGLDGRAWRMAELARAVVFEVDHPATQRLKRARSASLGAPPGEVRYVGVDFERDKLSDRLAEAGHDTSRPTVWICEGVITYLTTDALRATLATVFQRSAPSSRLLAQYQEPPPASVRGVAGLSWVVRRMGEPHIGRRPRAEMHGELSRAGLEVLGDSGAADWAERFGDHLRLLPLATYLRLVVAERS